MMKESPAKIFLNEQRGLIDTDLHKRYCTFNFNTYLSEHKKSFGSLYVFNDEQLAPGSAEMNMEVKEASYVILIPVTGDFLYKGMGGHLNINIGQVLISSLPAGSSFQVVNPYDNEINFLQIWIKAKNGMARPFTRLLDFDLNEPENTLIELTKEPGTGAFNKIPFRLKIGQFAAREGDICKMNSKSSLFSFVLAGAFEMEGRLLQTGDGLALWNTDKAEIEALSNNAILVTLELFN